MFCMFVLGILISYENEAVEKCQNKVSLRGVRLTSERGVEVEAHYGAGTAPNFD